MADQKQPVGSCGQHGQKEGSEIQPGFKQIDLKIAYRALIDGFLQAGYNEAETPSTKSNIENS